VSYTPHNFVNGEIIEAEPINEMDRQIQTNETNIGLKLNKSDVYNGLDYTEEGKALDARQGRALNQAVGGKISSTEKGAANGVAELDSNGKVPSSQLPSYVDDIIEGYYYNGKFYKEAAHTTEITGETGKIYVDLASEKTYRWGGSEYVEISASLALGETSSTAYRGDRGKDAYDHATDANRLTTAQTEGLYKVATTAEGHIKSVSAVEKSDITALGIPGSQPDVSGKADKVSDPTSGNFAGLDANGNLTDSGSKASDFLTQHQDISGKADKVTGATAGNFAGLDSNGNLTDSGKKPSDFLTQHQDISGKADKDTDAVVGNFASFDSNGNPVDSGHKHSDYITSHQDISGKADKVSSATNGNFAGLDANGNLVDSGKKASDFSTTDTIAAAYYQSKTSSQSGITVTYVMTAEFTSYNLRNGNTFQLVFPSNQNLGGTGLITVINLNVNGTGEKRLYYNGSGSTSGALLITKGVYWVYYDGSNYYLRTDGLSTPKINGKSIGAAIEKDVDSTISSGSTSTNLPTSAAVESRISGATGGKADKVSGATSGNFAALDSNGNLTDSGHKHSDYLTEHQDISGKIDVSEKGEANGVAELDSAGKVPTSQLPSYVDDVVEYSSISEFPATGESGKIYVDTSTNKTYRWGGSEYVAISSDLALGETSSTAYRGDRGAAAYAHSVTNKGSQYSTGLYKIGTNSEGHVNAAVAVTKQDIVDLGIPGEAGGDASALHEIEFSLATTDWTLSSGVYTATVTNSYICSTSVDFVMYSSSINSYLMDNIETEKNATNHTLTFKTGVMPTGTITGTIYSLVNNDGQTAVALIDEKLPIENGGTNATTASAARDNLGVAARSNLAIVEDTDTATHAIAAGQYVIWKGATCVASSAITIGDTLSASNLTTKSGGVANDIIAQKGVANGFASLDSNGLIPSNQLPSYVDDVQEYNNTSAFPATGETGKIYVAKDTNKSYRWSGSGYIELSSYAVATQSASGLMSATDKTKLDGIAQSTLVNVPFSIATTDWTLSTGVYTAEFTTSYVTANSKEIVQYDSSLRTYGAYDIDVAKKSGGGGMVFTTMIIPTGTISGNIFVFANEDGNIAIVVVDNVLPVTAGGTGATTEAGARTALGLGDAAQKTVSDTSTAAAIADDTNLPTDRTVRNAIYNGLDQTNAGYMLDARQGKAISDTIGTVPSGKTVQGQIDTLGSQIVISIASGTDLNTLTEPGFYNTTSAISLTNAPVNGTNRLSLLVQKSENGYIFQQATENLQNTYGVFTRRCLNGTWTSWEQLALNTQITIHKATVTGETGYTVEINEIYYRGNESHCSGTTRIRGNFGTGWTETIATIDKKPSAEVIVPAINVTDGTFIGMATIRADGTIGLYNSTGTAYMNKAIGFTASW